MPNGEFVEAIAGLVHCDVEEHRGHNFHITNDGAKLLQYPTEEPTKCFSLTQLVNYIKFYSKDWDSIDSDETRIVNILDHETVNVADKALNDNCKIDVEAETCFKGMFQPFRFGQKLSQEDFVIEAMTKFKTSPARDELLRTVSSVKAERISESHDDGISQVAATKAGVHLSQKTTIQNLWLLQTFKTFPEVEQPTIPYILRLHQRDEEAPQFALYECDGGQWKVDLAIKVREWLTQTLKVELVDNFDRVVIL